MVRVRSRFILRIFLKLEFIISVIVLGRIVIIWRVIRLMVWIIRVLIILMSM